MESLERSEESLRKSTRLKFKRKFVESKSAVRPKSNLSGVNLNGLNIDMDNPSHQILFLYQLGLSPSTTAKKSPFLCLTRLSDDICSKPGDPSSVTYDSRDDPELRTLESEALFCPLDFPKVRNEILNGPVPLFPLSPPSHSSPSSISTESGYTSLENDSPSPKSEESESKFNSMSEDDLARLPLVSLTNLWVNSNSQEENVKRTLEIKLLEIRTITCKLTRENCGYVISSSDGLII